MNGPGFEGQVRAALSVAAGLGRPWGLVGGLAVSARAEPRFTRDLDLAVSVVDDRDAEDAVRTFLSRRYRPIWTLESRVEGRLAGVRLAPPGPETTSGEEAVTDLLFASSGIEREVAAAATRVEVIPGLVVPVAFWAVAGGDPTQGTATPQPVRTLLDGARTPVGRRSERFRGS